jgi:hypothetical protein
MQALSKFAFLVDRVCQTHTFESFWKQNMFPLDLINSQEDSLLTNLPPEIRLMIYKHVLSCSNKTSRHKLAILAACRQIRGEAIVTALKNTCFHVNKHSGLDLQSKLWSLGTLKQHLRHIKV